MRTSLIHSFYLCYIFISIPTFTLVTHSQLSASNFIFVTHSIQFLYLTRFHAPYHISAICSRSTYPRRLQLYSKFKFFNYLTPKIGLVSEKFSYGPWEALKVGRVAHFLLRFCLKIDYNFKFTERRWNCRNRKQKTSWGWAVPRSVEVKVWGLVKALSLIFENGNVEEVWSQRNLKLRKLLDEKV